MHLKRVTHEQASGYANTENDTDVLQHFVTCQKQLLERVKCSDGN